MKRNWFMTLFLVLVLGGMTCAVVCLNNPELFAKEQKTETGKLPEIRYREARVQRGQVPYAHKVQGEVACVEPEGYIVTVEAEDITERNFELRTEKGEEPEPGDVLFTLRRKDRKADFRARVIGVSYETVSVTDVTDGTDGTDVTERTVKNAVIRLLDYDRLCISTRIDAGLLGKINYRTPVTARIGETEVAVEIEDIDFQITGGTVGVTLSLPVRALPGAGAEVSFVYEVRDNALYVPADMLYRRGDDWSADILSGGQIVRRGIEVGQSFTGAEDGIEYMEVTRGLSAGDILVVEEFSPQGTGETPGQGTE